MATDAIPVKSVPWKMAAGGSGPVWNLAKVEVASSSLVSRSNEQYPEALKAFMALRAFSEPSRGARWQSGHAAACKAVYAGSIPTLASRTLFSRV